MKKLQKITAFVRGTSFLTVALSVSAASAGGGGTLLVPQEYPTIQSAINAASPGGGDEIIVAPGTYYEAIDFIGAAVHLRSAEGPKVTVINASGLETSVVTFSSDEGPDSVIEGFTLTWGAGTLLFGERYGGGALVYLGAHPTIINCSFQGNTAHFGGGVYISASSNPTMIDCTFSNNVANRGGGLMSNWSSNPTLTNCLFQQNLANVNGGAIESAGGSAPSIENSYLCGNTPNNIVGSWTDLGGNSQHGNCPEITFLVPEDYPTIQSAIDALPLTFGHTIIVAPGIYNEAIDFNDRIVSLQSAEGPEVTVIDASGLGASVVTCTSGEGPHTSLIGFTITGGTGTTVGSTSIGGGMYNVGASPTVTNCIFVANSAEGGGAIANLNKSSPTFTYCTFQDNLAFDTGGAVWNHNFSNPVFHDCTFQNNSAIDIGGAVANSANCHAWLNNCTFLSNSAAWIGGAISSENSEPWITNCTFEGNAAGSQGGAVFSDNASETGIGSSIFCESTPDHVEGPWKDLGGNEFSDSCDPGPGACPADLTGNGSVGVSDLLVLLSAWGPNPGHSADLTGSGSVGVSDLLMLLVAWGPCNE